MATLKIPVTSKDHIQGSANAPVTLVEYGDYQCPFCGQAYYVIKKLQTHYGSKIKFVFRNFPLAEIHPYAVIAAEAAEFAAEYEKFWEMHDLIYENQDVLGMPLLLELSKNLKLSSEDLVSSIEKNAHESKIRSDFLGGVRSGVNGTPTFFINDQRYNQPFEFENFVEVIDLLL